MKISIATVTYNAADHIERTIESLEDQDYEHVEHVIIDGNSQDRTLEIVQHYLERNSHAEHPHEIVCRSEPDEGLYDAMNKALDLASGDYILFLNAGDTLASSHTLSEIAALAESQPGVIYGDTDIVDEGGNFIRHRRLTPPEKLTWKSFRSGMLVCHQAFYARMDLAKETKYQDEKYRYSADFDWCVRVMKLAAQRKLELKNAHAVVAKYLDLEDALTNQHHQASLRERYRIMVRHYGFISTSLRHLWFVLRQFTKR